jgi:hypothetical protein
MTGKSDFTEDEWTLILEGPMTAGMILITAAHGGTFRETLALAHAYDDARREHGASALLDEIVSTKPKFDRHRYPSSEALHDEGLDQIRKAVAVLRSKATPGEVDDYSRFLLAAAGKVASAHKEDGVEVSPPEQAALDELGAAVAAEPAP